MKRILSVTDLSDGSMHAIHYGSVLTDKLNSDFFICHIIEMPAIGLCDFQWEPISYINRTISDSTEKLHKIINRYHIDAELIIRPGSTKIILPTVIDEKKIDFVIFPLEVGAGPNLFILKNIVGRLAGPISRPLLIVPNKKLGQVNIDADYLRFDKILIGCGPSKILPSTMDCIVRISEVFSSEIHFICITNREFHFKEFHQNTHESFKGAIKQFISGENQSFAKTVKTVLKSGNPPDQLLEYAKKNSIDMILLDTENSDYGKQIYSPSSVRRIISNTHCPVLLPSSN